MRKDYFFLAIKNLRRRKLRSWLTILGIIIGVASVVSLISLGQGMQEAIKDQFTQLGSDKLTIKIKGSFSGPPGSNSNITLTKSDLNIVQKSKGVFLATGRLIKSIKLEFNNKKKYLLAASIPEDEEEAKMVYEALLMDISEGRLLKKGDKYKILISDYYKSDLFNGKGLSLGDKVIINNKTFEIAGIFKKTGNPIIDKTIFLKENVLRELTNDKNNYNIIVVKVDDSKDINLISENIKKDLRKFRGLKKDKEDFDIQKPKNLLRTFNSILSIIQLIIIGIAAISLLVGGIGISNTMYTAVLERKKEIGIMKAIGAKNSDILYIFLFESGIIGLIGSFLGLIIGVLLSKIIVFLAYKKFHFFFIKVVFPLWLIIASLFFGFIIGLFAGVFPAFQASKEKPVDALRD